MFVVLVCYFLGDGNVRGILIGDVHPLWVGMFSIRVFLPNDFGLGFPAAELSFPHLAGGTQAA